ncbi:GNAT family N-acetyltransferase [Vibrio sp. ZSDZ34]|uniref:GNAT family N-acetyltransferase n=1 Tax=Vibrio gelatinilyticus TaxID=2893468 RepID=A0A9X1WHJ9_9VIBR|nr:GNAT family protein [Vibrio gelatinilyticus]MCJ2376709.1 GNAT family N-acetyltransferase [Vibrio gelatinilyticus]
MNTALWLKDIELNSDVVRLVPLQKEHRDDLVNAAADGKLWTLWFTSVPSEHSIDDYIETALQDKKLGRSLPFVVIEKSTNKVIGSTRFCNADPKNKRLEIGYTWYAKRYQRSAVNSHCKRLLLQHAFESLDVIAVEFRTHWHNQKSRSAIARLGAKQDGVLRNHQKMSDGSYRDTVVFSIIDQEWPVVRKSLDHKLAEYL